MAATLDKILGGLRPHVIMHKNGATGVVGRLFNTMYQTGIPGAAVAPSPGVAGQAVTSYAGLPVLPTPGVGETAYLSRVSWSSSIIGTLILCDRLWHNSGLSVTSTAVQTVNSVPFAARDNNMTADGEGVMIGLEVSANMGAGAPTVTLTYTDSDAGAQSTVTPAMTASMIKGSFIPVDVQGGVRGTQSIQTFKLSASMTSGAIHLVAYKVLAVLPITIINRHHVLDALGTGLPNVTGAVPMPLWLCTATTVQKFGGALTVSAFVP